jgi:hypothetical protein
LRSIGIENFEKEILIEASSSEEMFERERELVELGPHSYNLKEGGEGGFDYILSNRLQGFCDLALAKKGRALANISLEEKHGDEWRSAIGRLGGVATKEKGLGIFDPIHRSVVRVAQLQTNAAMQKKKETFKQIGHSQGERNSQFGTMWITDDHVSRKIKKTDPIPEGWRKGRRIKNNGE